VAILHKCNIVATYRRPEAALLCPVASWLRGTTRVAFASKNPVLPCQVRKQHSSTGIMPNSPPHDKRMYRTNDKSDTLKQTLHPFVSPPHVSIGDDRFITLPDIIYLSFVFMIQPY